MAGVLLIAGGGFVGISCFLPWFSLSVSLAGISFAAHQHGIDTGAGKLALLLALVSLVLAGIDWNRGDGSLRRWSVGAALAGAAIVLYKSMYYRSQFSDPSGISHASFGSGTWVALLGAGAVIVGALLARE